MISKTLCTKGHLLARYFKPSTVSMRHFSSVNDSFIHGNSGAYLNDLYDEWKKNPSSVDTAWASFFASQALSPPSKLATPESTSVGGSITANTTCRASILDHMKVQLLVRAYQVRGHHRANLDPLGILRPDLDFVPAPELDLEFYGFDQAQLDEEFVLGQGMLPNFRSDGKETMTLRDIVRCLKEAYCGTIGFEYTHVPERDRCDWVRSRIEVPVKYQFSKEQKQRILDRLIWSDSFERFVHSKFPGEKRFGLEGCEALIPGMKELIDVSVDHGVENIVIGMSHRGRLNVLTNVVRKPAESIFCEFIGEVDKTVSGSGDVKYHLGMNYDRPTPSGKRVALSLVANPSHLEAVNPVVQGKTRAHQFYTNDTQGDHAMGVLIHGDAAFAGQGVVYESLGLADLPSYTTFGTIHLVINNQIGFTTDPRFSRSTPYCTDVAKTIRAPILHVNADDVEAVVFACQFAADWRKQYKKDIVIDLICYRRYGHNEFDEPSFTQPRMYQAIAKKPRVLDVYVDQLLKEGLISKSEIESNKAHVWGILETCYQNSKTYKPTVKEWLTSTWDGFKSPKEISTEITQPRYTGVADDTLQMIGAALSRPPADFDLHKGLVKVLEGKKKSIETGEGIDMPTAEALAFGSLLLEGNHVRLSGQDVERGTFSHRHAVLHDQKSERKYVPLDHLDPSQQGKFSVCNSSLSEFGILGFELGYSLVNPRSLILWEAQFGDFANNAQCIIDQFLVSGERKWHQRSGLTVLLPHGYDGNGPEHSSGRMERFLQLCDDNADSIPDFAPEKCRQIQDCNIQVVYPSTPANYFHVLRRQIHRDFRKPLIVFNSKALLRHPLARSLISEMTPDTKFQRVIPELFPEQLVASNKVKSLVFCSGQVYYTLLKAREANHIKDVALVRLEQISPFPYDMVMEQLQHYPNIARLVWAQEEPINMGAWTYVQPRFQSAQRHLGKKAASSTMVIQSAARAPSSAVATGLKKQHHSEELDLVSEALYGSILKVSKEVNGIPIYKQHN